MKWHRENSLNGQYTDTDVSRHRGVCQGCVYGALHPTPTDPYRDHRPIPLIPGQCFALDAYTHHTKPLRVAICIAIFLLTSRLVVTILSSLKTVQHTNSAKKPANYLLSIRNGHQTRHALRKDSYT